MRHSCVGHPGIGTYTFNLPFVGSGAANQYSNHLHQYGQRCGGCQSNNFDAQIAETTISMIAYLLLTLRYRYEHYESMGVLYRSMDADELLEKMLTNQKAEGMISALLINLAIDDD